jgi:hypothetical protein
VGRGRPRRSEHRVDQERQPRSKRRCAAPGHPCGDIRARLR